MIRRVTQADTELMRALRQRMPVSEVALRLGLAHSTVSDYLNGRRQVREYGFPPTVHDPILGPLRECRSCGELWPTDATFYANDGHGSCLACEADKRRAWTSRQAYDAESRSQRNRRDYARRRAA